MKLQKTQEKSKITYSPTPLNFPSFQYKKYKKKINKLHSIFSNFFIQIILQKYSFKKKKKESYTLFTLYL